MHNTENNKYIKKEKNINCSITVFEIIGNAIITAKIGQFFFVTS